MHTTDELSASFYSTQEILAKLLAKEDIVVRLNSNIDGLGLFNMKLRILYVTKLAPERQNLLPGIVGHEIGHALYSSMQEDKGEEFQNKFHHSIWNIIEDGYVDRRVSKDYPGLRPHRKAVFDYAFGDWNPEKDVSPLVCLINTLTYNCKGFLHGAFAEFPKFVTPQDLALFKSCETYYDENTTNRIAFAKLVMDRVLSYKLKEEKKQPKPRAGGWSEENETEDDPTLETPIEIPPDENSTEEIPHDENSTEEIPPEETEPKNEELPSLTDEVEDHLDSLLDNAPKAEDKEGEEKDLTTDAEGDGGVGENDEGEEELPEGVYDDDKLAEELGGGKKDDIVGLKKSLFGNFQTSTNEQSFNFPSFENIDKFSSIYDILDPVTFDKENVLPNGMPKSFKKSPIYNAWMNSYAKHIVSARAAAQKMFQYFNQRTNAMNMAMRQYQKTGSLDPTRSALYRIYDDVFNRRCIDANQQNHAYVVMLDWSGSMKETTIPLVHRVMELTAFAHLAGVEIEVWLYTDVPSGNRYDSNSENEFERMCMAMKNSETGGVDVSEQVEEYIQKNRGQIVKPARFIRVTNTKHDTQYSINNRLQALFAYALGLKKSIFQFDKHTMGRVMQVGGTGIGVSSKTLNFYNRSMSQLGTSIYESMVFGGKRLLEMKAQVKNLIIMTDGSDCNFDRVLADVTETRVDELGNPITKVRSNIIPFISLPLNRSSVLTFGGVDITSKIMEYGDQLTRQDSLVVSDETVTSMPNFQDIRIAVTRVVGDLLRTKNINVYGCGWNMPKRLMKKLDFTMGGESINITFANNKGKTQRFGPSEYTHINNKFITQIGSTLLGKKQEELRKVVT